MRKRWIAVVAVIGGLWWTRRDEPAGAAPGAPQAAVLADGFAVLEGKRLVWHDRSGRSQAEATVRIDQADVRLVGTSIGAGLGWRDGRKIKLGVVDGDGRVEVDSAWGKNVRKLCEGVATNEHQFGIGWLEADGRTWVVHGPTSRAAAAQAEPLALATSGFAGPRSDAQRRAASIEPTAKSTWCGIASAEQNLALLWRDGGRLWMNFCNRRACSGMVVRVGSAERDTLLGFGCVRESCLFATRDAGGETRLHRVDERGRTIIRPLDDAAATGDVSVVGVGRAAFAVAYVTGAGRVAVRRVSVEGDIANVTELEGGRAPGLAWADGRLLIARPAGATTVVALPQ